MMTAELPRTGLDRVGAILLLLAFAVLFGYQWPVYTLLGKTAYIAGLIVAAINAIFVNVTPIARLRGSVLYLYSEVQPNILAWRPGKVDLSRLTALTIDRGLLQYRAVFSLRHGEKVYHGFPAAREARVVRLMTFLKEHVRLPAVQAACEQSLK